MFVDAESTEAILLAVQDFFFDEQGKKSPGELGRVGLAGFSASNGQVAYFLAKRSNRTHPFYIDTLREVYLFDPPSSAIAGAVGNALTWAKAGGHDDKMIRLYNQWHTSYMGTLVGKTVPRKDSGAFESSADGTKTAAYLPISVWQEPLKNARRPFYFKEYPDNTEENFEENHKQILKKRPIKWNDLHSWIPQTLLTDALRRSQFP